MNAMPVIRVVFLAVLAVRNVAELEQFAGANERVLLLNVRRGDGTLFIAIQ